MRAFPPRRVIPLALVFLGAVAPAVAAADPEPVPSPEQWRVERSELREPLEGLERVRIENPWGDVRVRAEDGDGVYLLTHVQRHREDPRALGPRVERGSDALVLRIASGGELEGDEPPGFARRRVDATLFVPPDVRLEVVGRDGTVDVRGLDAPVRVETGRGPISVRIRGPLVAASEHGAVDVVLRSTAWDAPTRIETVTGPIAVWLPASAPADVELATRGAITTDYSLVLEREAGSRLKRGRATIGAGGATLVLSSRQGDLALRDGAFPPAVPDDQEVE